VGLLSAIIQGQVAAAGISIIAKKPDELVKAMMYAVMVEFYAILALLMSFLAYRGVPL
jgi:V/A-type H+-transporting ATPase subunit K